MKTVRGGVLAWLLVVCCVCSAHAGVLWISGMETGQDPVCDGANNQTKSEWNVCTGTCTAATDQVRSGAYALKCTSGSKVNAIVEQTTQATMYLRAYVFLTANPSSAALAINSMSGVTGTSQIELYINTDGTMGWADHGSAVHASGATALTLNAWNRVEAKMVTDSTVGGVELYVNGTLQLSSLNNNTNGTQMAIRFNGNGSQTFWFDDMTIRNDQYAGPGRLIARQGTAGTPTYDSWTKTSCVGGTIDGCWSNTPTTSTSHASTTTQNNTQSMLVALFSTTQTGHGSDVIQSGDTINAINIGVVQESSGGVQTIQLLHRAGGVDTFINRDISGATSWVSLNAIGFNTQTPALFTDTFANLDAYETGGKKTAATGASFQIDDIWMMVDYCDESPCGGGVRVKVRQN